eukprot:363159-Chlamydomonas_euryale.AAC.2
MPTLSTGRPRPLDCQPRPPVALAAPSATALRRHTRRAAAVDCRGGIASGRAYWATVCPYDRGAAEAVTRKQHPRVSRTGGFGAHSRWRRLRHLQGGDASCARPTRDGRVPFCTQKSPGSYVLPPLESTAVKLSPLHMADGGGEGWREKNC